MDEVSEKSEEMSESFSQAGSELEESASLLEEYSKQFKGAGSVLLGSLTLVASGLLSQVPVIQEAMGGLNAILDALFLRLDSKLRPAINKITNTLFGIADTITQLKGPWGDLLDIVIVSVASFLGLVAVGGLLVGAFAAISAIAGVVSVSLATVGAVLAALSVAVGLFAKAYEKNWLGVRDITDTIVKHLVQAFEHLISFATDMWNDPIKATFDFIESILVGIGRLANAGGAIFAKFFNRVRAGFEFLFGTVVAAAKRFGNTVVGIFENAVNSAITAIPQALRAELGIGTVNLSRPFDPRSQKEIARKTRWNLKRRDTAVDIRESKLNQDLERQVASVLQALQNSVQEFTVNIDGRKFAKSQERFLGNGATGVSRVRRTR